MIRVFTALVTVAGLAPAAWAQPAPQFSLPIACTPGKDCFIQQYVDMQLGAGQKDYRCGIVTYDEHSGTDFRLLSVKAAAAGVSVLASAPGRVKGRRDGVEDRLIATEADRATVKGRECGNGVVIDHGAGWETQYCHLLRGSVKVREGDMVAAGAPLGLVGFSGEAQFAHVHFEVRRNGQKIDPFLGEPIGSTCLAGDKPPASSLWTPAARDALVYQDAVVLETGFAAQPVTPDTTEQGGITAPAPDSPMLILYGRAINLRQGDRLRITAEGPGGFTATNESEAMPHAKAQFVAFAGRERTAPRWPEGVYQGTVAVLRDGVVIREAKVAFRMPPAGS